MFIHVRGRGAAAARAPLEMTQDLVQARDFSLLRTRNKNTALGVLSNGQLVAFVTGIQ